MIKFENPLNGRFYYLQVEKDLLADFVLIAIRGGINHRVTRRLVVNDLQKINKEIERISNIRIKHGYIYS